QYLKSSAGLIESTDYYATTTAGEGTPGRVAGYEQDTKIQQGQSGTAIQQSSSTYSAHSAGDFTIYVPASDSVFHTGNPTVAQLTSYSYTWYPTYFGVQSLRVTLPVINYLQNGSGMADTETGVFDMYGNETWHRDAGGSVF